MVESVLQKKNKKKKNVNTAIVQCPKCKHIYNEPLDAKGEVLGGICICKDCGYEFDVGDWRLRLTFSDSQDGVSAYKKPKKPAAKYWYITKDTFENITRTPPKECWICDELSKHIYKDAKGYYIKWNDLDNDEGIQEHLRQLGGATFHPWKALKRLKKRR
jgi:transcription elongation factor Elf1